MVNMFVSLDWLRHAVLLPWMCWMPGCEEACANCPTHSKANSQKEECHLAEEMVERLRCISAHRIPVTPMIE